MTATTTSTVKDVHSFCRSVFGTAGDLMNSEIVDQMRRVERVAALLPNLALPNKISSELRREIWLFQGGECNYCDQRISDDVDAPFECKMHIDHKVPLSRGGGHEGNLQALCAPCNLRKANKTDREYRALYPEFITKPKSVTWDDVVNELPDTTIDPISVVPLVRLMKRVVKWSLATVARHPYIAIAVLAVVVIAYVVYRLLRAKGRRTSELATQTREWATGRARRYAGPIRRLPGRAASFAGRTRNKAGESAGQIVETARDALADRRRRMRFEPRLL